MNRTRVCMYCLKDQTMKYIGGDPENGAARLTCGDQYCELNLEDDADFKFKMEASIDEAWDLAEEENGWIDHMDRLYPEIENDEYFEMYDQALDHSYDAHFKNLEETFFQMFKEESGFDEMFTTDHSKLWSPYFLGKRE